jgi:hypothetical protein
VATIGVIAGAGSAVASYTPAYTTTDLIPAIIDLITTVVVAVAGQGNIIGQLAVLMLLLGLLSVAIGSVAAMAMTAMGFFQNFGKKKL